MTMTNSEIPVAEFYAHVMGHRPPEVQRMVIRLLNGEFKQSSELEAGIMAVAAMSRAEPIRDQWASEQDDMIMTVNENGCEDGDLE